MTDHAIAPNPYTPPTAAAIPLESHPDGQSDRRGAFKLLAASVGIFGLTVAAMALFQSATPGPIGFGVASLVGLLGFGRAILSLVRSARSPGPAETGFTGTVVLALLASGFMAGFGALAALMSTMTFSRGRQLRSLGRVLLPRVEPAPAWAHLPLDVEAPEGLRSALAAQWRENGRTEHASVAAFARLTLDLMALGAPPALVAAANRDALDEIRHTEICFSLARALDGKSESPGPFPGAQRARTLASTRTLALAELAVDSLIDGALHEGISARVLARLGKRCEEPQIRALIKEIAADEGRHAAHGWNVVEWCLAEGGGPVARALSGALRALPRGMRTPLPAAAEDGRWERYGIVSRAIEAEELTRTRADLVRRVEAMIGAGSAAVAA